MQRNLIRLAILAYTIEEKISFHYAKGGWSKSIHASRRVNENSIYPNWYLEEEVKRIDKDLRLTWDESYWRRDHRSKS